MRGREHFWGCWALDGRKPGPRADPQEPAAERSGPAFRRSGRVGWKRELVGGAANGLNSEGWAGEDGCGRYPMIAEKHLQNALACAEC